MLKLCCSACGIVHFYDESLVCCAFDSAHITCYHCDQKININCETATTNVQPIAFDLPMLPIGALVVIINKEHPWSDDIGIIRGKKYKHYRIEIHGQLIWMPENWIKQHEFDDTD
jgi:3D (Asp-Asp-Asp) domain-containing protein